MKMEALAADKSDSSRRFRFVRYENNLNSGCRTQTELQPKFRGILGFLGGFGVTREPKKQFSNANMCKSGTALRDEK
jgi:hypothetical protein